MGLPDAGALSVVAGFLTYAELLGACCVSRALRRALLAARWPPPPGPMLATLAAAGPGEAAFFCRVFSVDVVARDHAARVAALTPVLQIPTVLPTQRQVAVAAALAAAARAGHTRKLALLHAWAGDTRLTPAQLVALLREGCATGRPAVAQWIVEHGRAEPPAAAPAVWLRGAWRAELLAAAAGAGHLDLVRWLAGSGRLGFATAEVCAALALLEQVPPAASSVAARLARNWLVDRAALWDLAPGEYNEAFG